MLSGRYAGLMEALLDALARGDIERAAVADATIRELLQSERLDSGARNSLEALRDAYAEALARCTGIRDRLADDVAQGRKGRTATHAYRRHSVT